MPKGRVTGASYAGKGAVKNVGKGKNPPNVRKAGSNTNKTGSRSSGKK